MDHVQVDNLKLVNTFPSFSSISVIENIFATLWAGIVQDEEAVVSDFLMIDGWDYQSFLQIAETRKIAVLYRCAFSLFAPDRTLQPHGDRSRRGRYREQLQTYRRIVSIILNAAKDIWLEPQQQFQGRSELVDLKRNVCGLYLLYYLWHNQVPADRFKVLIQYSIEDERRARIVGQKFIRLETNIPNCQTVKKCYQFTVTSLSKRNALCYTYIVDEPKLDFSHWQHMRLKNGVVRKALTSVNSNSHFCRAISEIEIVCSFMIEILKEVREISRIPIERSLFFRKIMPLAAIKDMLQLDDQHRPVIMKLPFDYSELLSDMSAVISKNVDLMSRQFLHIDCLLQTDQAPQKIRSLCIKQTKDTKQRNLYNKKVYERKKADFNKLCEMNKVPLMKIPKTRKYRTLESPAWLFISRKFNKMFSENDGKAFPGRRTENNGSATASASTSAQDQNNSAKNSTEKVPSYCNVQPFPRRRSTAAGATSAAEVSQELSAVKASRTSVRVRRKPGYLQSFTQVPGETEVGPCAIVKTEPNWNPQTSEPHLVSSIVNRQEGTDQAESGFTFHENEKLLQTTLQRKRITVIEQSAEEIADIYGIKRRKQV